MMVWPTGEKYEGEWYEDKKHGTGTYYYSNGSVYSGDFINDTPHGYGEFKKGDDKVYKGFWENGNPTGIALQIEDGIKTVGSWNQSEFVKWTLVTDVYEDSDIMNDTDEAVVVNKLEYKN